MSLENNIQEIKCMSDFEKLKPKSKFKICAPIASCKKIDAITIGPIPAVIIFPISPASRVWANKISWTCLMLVSSPIRLMFAKIKNITSAPIVQSIFSLNETSLVGFLISGKYWEKPISVSIIAPNKFTFF